MDLNQRRCQPPLSEPELRDIVDSAVKYADARPIIQMREGSLHNIVDAAEAAVARHENVFSRGNTLVRVILAQGRAAGAPGRHHR